MTIAKHYKCGICGWVHFELSLDAAQAHTDAVNAALPKDGKPVTVDRYFACSRCGASSATFVPALPGDAPPLSTLRGIVLQSMREQKKCEVCVYEQHEAAGGRIVTSQTCARCGWSKTTRAAIGDAKSGDVTDVSFDDL